MLCLKSQIKFRKLSISTVNEGVIITPDTCYHVPVWNEVCGNVFWNTKPHTNVGGILLMTSCPGLPPYLWLENALDNRGMQCSCHAVLVARYLVLDWHYLGISQDTLRLILVFLAHPKKYFRTVNQVEVCLSIVSCFCYVWRSTQQLKVCFENNAIYEQSGMNIPNCLTNSGISQHWRPVRHRLSNQEHLWEWARLPLSSCSCSVINDLTVKWVTRKHMSFMHLGRWKLQMMLFKRKSMLCLSVSIINVWW